MNIKSHLTQFFYSSVDKHTHGDLSCKYRPPDILSYHKLFILGAALFKQEIDKTVRSISDLIILITSFNLKKVYD